MKLKPESKRKDTECSASRCTAEGDLTAYAHGVKFDPSQGKVNLCKRHGEMRDAEQEAERQAAPARPVDPVSALAPEVLKGVPPQAAVSPPPAAPNVLAAGLAPLTLPGTDVLARAQAETKEASDILALVQAFQVQGQADLDFANECLGDVKSKAKALEEQRKEATQHLDKALKVIRGWFKPALDFYGQCETIWKLKIRDGFMALQQSQQAALQLAGQAHAAGNVTAVAQSMVAANAVAVSLPANVSVVERWAWRVTDAALVPRDFLCVDTAKVDAFVKAMKGATAIPGIQVYPDNTVVRRA